MQWEPWRAIFSTICVVEGKALFAAEHLAQMKKAAAALGIPWSRDFSQDPVPKQTGRLRWILSPTQSDAMFSEEPIRPARPVRLVVSPIRVGSQNWDARFKTISYLAHAQARQLAAPAEALQLNEHGHIASAATANVFWVRDGQVYSPIHEAGCREGVVRSFVASQTLVQFDSFPLSDLKPAEEIFLTNSLRGIVPVNQLEWRPLSIGPITKMLMDKYQEEIRRQLKDIIDQTNPSS